MDEEEENEVINYYKNGNAYEILKLDPELQMTIISNLQQENKELKERIETLKELDLYECESDYDYEENLELNYVPFDIEEFLKGDK